MLVRLKWISMFKLFLSNFGQIIRSYKSTPKACYNCPLYNVKPYKQVILIDNSADMDVCQHRSYLVS
jgi:hypothetical protein